MVFPPSQGPDLNRGVADLQSTAWPLRHLGILFFLDLQRVFFTKIFFNPDKKPEPGIEPGYADLQSAA